MISDQTIGYADDLRRQGRLAEAVEAYLEAAKADERPEWRVSLGLARCYADLDDLETGYRWLMNALDAESSFTAWQAAAGVLDSLSARRPPPAKRRARLALLGSYTTSQMVPMLRLAALRRGIDLDIYEGAYGLYRQEIIDKESDLYRFAPDFVVIAVHESDVQLTPHSGTPEADVEVELARWKSLWSLIRERCAARVIQHNFAIKPETPFGHLSTRLPGSRYRMLGALNERLGEAAGQGVAIFDSERLSAFFGKQRWFDDRYWHLAKQGIALDALPLVARHSGAVLMAELGLSRKCLVLDLDNTLWGGVIGEDGLSGIALGHGPRGEAYVAFQEYVLALKQKGVILAVCSKNNEADALSPFNDHPDMRIRLEDVAVFLANWDTKPENLRRVAQILNIGLDALVFVDDNPGEREIVRQMLPEVEVVTLPPDPALYVRALEESLHFETASFTPEDAQRTEQYRARAEVARLETSAESIEDFYRSLHMEAQIAPFDELHLPRIVQLIGKTNQFNLTTRRHSMESVRGFMESSDWVTFYLKLRDRFVDHGLVGLMIARRDEQALEIDTWLMSCRVIGRTVEAKMLAHLCHQAQRLDCSILRGVYSPTPKNEMVADIYKSFGFAAEGRDGESTIWEYDLEALGQVPSEFIREATFEPA